MKFLFITALLIGMVFFVNSIQNEEPVEEPKYLEIKTEEVEEVEEIDEKWEEFKIEYNNACLENLTNINYCNCTIDFLEKENGREKVYKMAEEYESGGPIRQEMKDATVNCVRLY